MQELRSWAFLRYRALHVNSAQPERHGSKLKSPVHPGKVCYTGPLIEPLAGHSYHAPLGLSRVSLTLPSASLVPPVLSPLDPDPGT
jgi:hypothetical protein